MRCMLLHLLLVAALSGQSTLSVYGRDVAGKDPGVLLFAIANAYAENNGLRPTEEEMAPLRKKFGPLDAIHQRGAMDFAYNIVLLSKLNQKWWAIYGGKVVLSAFGMHLATDAMLREVDGLEKSGRLKFHDAEVRRNFIGHYQRYRGDGVIEGEKVKQLFAEGLGK